MHSKMQHISCKWLNITGKGVINVIRVGKVFLREDMDKIWGNSFKIYPCGQKEYPKFDNQR